jgi:hypothetical protein
MTPQDPALFAISLDFALFGLTLIGVAVFHHHTMRVALIGLVTISVYKIAFTGFKTGPGVIGFLSHIEHEWVILANLLCLLMGFALLSRHFVFDNILLTALALKQNGHGWGMLAYAVGFGGSMIWFGSSAGVAISNLFPEMRSVGAWVEEGWLTAVAYVVGFVVLLMLLGWHPAPKLRPEHGPPGDGITQVNNR